MFSRLRPASWRLAIIVLSFMIIAAVTFLCPTAHARAQEGQKNSADSRYRVFTLRTISPQKAAKYLADAGIGSVSHIPDTNTVLVTSSQRGLIVATDSPGGTSPG